MKIFPLACAEQLENIGLLVKNRRLERKIRQKDIADAVGISTQTLGKIETGAPSVEMRAYMVVLWHLGLLGDVFPIIAPPALATYAPEHRVRLKKTAKDDF
ncbi:helix-turn-helix domain-containing protein [Pseudomonas akapageensis]|uniref:helix-turn-helix domain-containing protein n=1 Tax=Pseudomonas akapageensis TaxID=2609961 RepID=UPI00140A0257|nr:helix-turn-helix transcriptional regulator [Pseudomonas akapageensis]